MEVTIEPPAGTSKFLKLDGSDPWPNAINPLAPFGSITWSRVAEAQWQQTDPNGVHSTNVRVFLAGVLGAVSASMLIAAVGFALARWINTAGEPEPSAP